MQALMKFWDLGKNERTISTDTYDTACCSCWKCRTANCRLASLNFGGRAGGSLHSTAFLPLVGPDPFYAEPKGIVTSCQEPPLSFIGFPPGECWILT
ncbi:uncharacterized protein LOC143235394 isoform X2 [Tachypleus tridentatus]|uniref:uncharacterized protein LOC143235394 isoform X2 n=1 Tax=Tachypleus tridentatus TaxID=6853 RepID=UPI003FCFCF98